VFIMCPLSHSNNTTKHKSVQDTEGLKQHENTASHVFSNKRISNTSVITVALNCTELTPPCRLDLFGPDYWLTKFSRRDYLLMTAVYTFSAVFQYYLQCFHAVSRM